MNIEPNMDRSATPLNLDTEHRTKISKEDVEALYKKYYKDMLKWTSIRLNSRNLTINGHHVPFPNLQEDAEEIISYVFKSLLSQNIHLDLSNDNGVRAYLNSCIDGAIGHHFKNVKAKKRIPPGQIDHIEDLTEDIDEEDLPPEIKRYLETPSVEGKVELEQAVNQLENKDPRLADVIRKRFFLGKTTEEIATELLITPQWVLVLEKKALAKLKFILTRKK